MTQKQASSTIRITNQYIKDLSFEIPKAPEIFTKQIQKPKVNISVDINATKLNDTFYEIDLKISSSSSTDEDELFILELQYCGIFEITGKKQQEELEQVLLIYCPNILFPFARRIIANTTSDGGFAAMLIDPIDFVALYQKRKSQNEQKS